MISESTRIRVIKALMGITSKEFAEKLGVSQNTVTGWEKGRSVPNGKNRSVLSDMCETSGIVFTQEGMPVPLEKSDATM